MTRAEPDDDFVRPPVDALAQLILEDAREDLSLVKRTRGTGKNIRVADASLGPVRQQSVSALCLLSDTDAANRVSIPRWFD